MTTTEGTAARDQRANRRAASVERAAVVAAEAAKQRQTATITLDADDGATVTLATEEIRQTAGNTPVARAAGMSGGNSGDASGNRTSGDGNGDPSCSTANAGASASTLDTTAGDTAMNAGVTAATIRGGTSASGNGGQGGAGFDSTPPARRTATAASSAEQAPARPIIVREKAKALKLTKFKGLDDVMPVSMWLKTVRAEVRRQAVTMGVEWREKQLYHEVASHLEGEAQRWFATVMESVPESQETIDTLSDMLRAKYMPQRTGPEVVDLLNARRQMRGERLVEYAQALREIGERGDVGEDWLVNAFLKGISSAEGATHVRGHRPRTLDEAVELAVPHVGEYGEGYGVGLDTAMARWDEREASRGRGPLAASAPGDKEQSGAAGNFGTVVSGYGL
ncbi:Retrovirus Polyprotein [Phytophthora cinnamomi]|uniref:Retrovirus Polyprotein n=1 Tax=Phytophthora cinnamomi TaxID=4785 RepID=UPI003559F8D8|nr:Retrovirus Polyprotein [Phytophthora cinnamomi]